ncbi:MAG: hypothetical protein HamCj_02150 [Candidatus Hamiltonella defensa (Ceratovacuna japonica)]
MKKRFLNYKIVNIKIIIFAFFIFTLHKSYAEEVCQKASEIENTASKYIIEIIED